MKLRHIQMAAIGASALIGLGCQYNYAPVLVEVRDRASHEPVAGADVRIANTHTLNPNPPAPATGVTGEDGMLVLEVGLYNDLIIRVTPRGGVEHVFSSEHPALVGPSAWKRPIRTANAVAPTVEIRLSPTAQSPETAEAEPATAPK